MTREEKINYWQGIMEEYERSGLSGAAFCRDHDINPGRFYHWRRRLLDSNESGEREGSFFELVPCTYCGRGGAIRNQLGGGITTWQCYPKSLIAQGLCQNMN